MKITVKMTLQNETKGALRYEGVGDEAQASEKRLIGTLYLRKDRVLRENGSFPTTIVVTVEG